MSKKKGRIYGWEGKYKQLMSNLCMMRSLRSFYLFMIINRLIKNLEWSTTLEYENFSEK